MLTMSVLETDQRGRVAMAEACGTGQDFSQGPGYHRRQRPGETHGSCSLGREDPLHVQCDRAASCVQHLIPTALVHQTLVDIEAKGPRAAVVALVPI